jgi:hypothetical protein
VSIEAEFAADFLVIFSGLASERRRQRMKRDRVIVTQWQSNKVSVSILRLR